MDKFLELVGMLGAAIVLLITMMIVANSRGGADTAVVLFGILPWALPAIVGSIIIAAFGNMLSQLKAIREAAERQNGLFQALLDRRTDA
ncbi:hypothetical protein MRBLRH8O_000146 [Agrobacterium radiobacter]|uniref:hypothetical protein n=1 Tax=Agrobacterium radiobacter TaxID=362 RepID=UPI0034654DBC